MNIRIVCLGLALSWPAFAQQNSSETHNTADQTTGNHTEHLEEVIVTAAPLENIAQPADVLDGNDLALKRAPTIGETLESQLGVNSSYFGPSSSRPIIRGLSGSRVSVLKDSVGTLDVSDVSADHATTVETLLVDGIEVIRGPSTLLYGNQAAGGVVNVIDNRIPKESGEKAISGAFEVRGDTAADEESMVGRLDGTSGSFGWHIDAFSRDTEDIDIDGFATDDPAQRPALERRGTLANSYSESDGYSAGASWLSDTGFVGIAVSELDSEYGLPGPGEDPGADPEDGPFLDLEESRQDLRGEFALDGFVESVKFAVGINDYEHKEIEPDGEVATVFENDQWQGRVEAKHSFGNDWHGAAGVQMGERDFSAVGEESFIPQTDTDELGLFVVEERDTEWGYLQLGGRIDNVEHRPSGGLRDYDETVFSFAVGAGWLLGDNHEISANLSRTERAPAAEELYSNGAHIATRQFEIGLLAMAGGSADEEISNNIDIGIENIDGRVNWNVALFYNRVDDYIFQNLTGAVMDGLPVANYVQDDAEFWGYEAEAVIHAHESNNGVLDLRVFSDFVRAKLVDGGDLPRIPPQRFGIGLTYDRGPWSINVENIFHDDQDRVSTFETDSYNMLNASVLYDLPGATFDWQFYVRGTNLLDEDARKATSVLAAFAPLPGQSWHAGIRTQF